MSKYDNLSDGPGAHHELVAPGDVLSNPTVQLVAKVIAVAAVGIELVRYSLENLAWVLGRFAS